MISPAFSTRTVSPTRTSLRSSSTKLWSDARDTVADQAAILSAQGVEYVHIPMPWQAPEAKHLEAMAAAMQRLRGKKVLVHCQVNLRASSMVFLHRVIVGKEPAEKAYDSVARVWVPNRVWKAYIVSMLRRHGSDFEPY